MGLAGSDTRREPLVRLAGNTSLLALPWVRRSTSTMRPRTTQADAKYGVGPAEGDACLSPMLADLRGGEEARALRCVEEFCSITARFVGNGTYRVSESGIFSQTVRW